MVNVIIIYHSLISGIENYDTLAWIMEKSETAKTHLGNTTILAWIHSHVNGNQCNFLSSIDVHNQRTLELTFGHIQCMVVEIDPKNPKKKASCTYNLTGLGRRRLDGCKHSPNNFHESCRRSCFYESASYEKDGFAPLAIYDFSIESGNEKLHLDSSGYLIFNTDQNMDADSNHYSYSESVKDKSDENVQRQMVWDEGKSDEIMDTDPNSEDQMNIGVSSDESMDTDQVIEDNISEAWKNVVEGNESEKRQNENFSNQQFMI